MTQTLFRLPGRTAFPALAFATLLLTGAAGTATAASPTVIELTQTGCQFLESEDGIDLGFMPMQRSDCDDENARTGADRVAGATPLHLAPGEYLFRVTNTDVPYELGFWLRGQGISRLILPSVSGGGMHEGVTNEYAITLEPGEYYYSCPLNTTPDYVLIVGEEAS